MPRGRPRKVKGPTIKDAIIESLTDLIAIAEKVPTAGSAWARVDQQGLVTCNFCHRSADTVKNIRHFEGSKAGEIIDDVLQVFDEPPCPALRADDRVDKARRLLEVLKNT